MAHNVHDALFKSTFSQVEHAEGELRLALPPAVSARIDFTSLALRPGSFVDEALAQRHSDLLFAARIAGREAYLYVLFEHQSSPEALMPYRLLRYEVRIWEDHLKRHPTATRLPAILPVVLHHSAAGWTAARSFEELLDVDEAALADLGELVPRFRFALDDLSHESDEALRERAMSALGRLSLYCLRHARTPEELLQGIGRWIELVGELRRAPGGIAALARIWRYILEVGEPSAPEDLVARLAAAVGDEGKEEIVTAGEQLIERGRQQGLKEGQRQGQREGQRRMLLKQLRARFGELPEAVTARVDAAEPEQLDVWAERVITAASLAEILAEA